MSRLSENEIERIALGIPKLTPAQRKAIYPGPGNPAYARGPSASMQSLQKLGLVTQVDHWTSGNGTRGGLLTAEGVMVRAVLQEESEK